MNEAAMAVIREGFLHGGITNKLWFSLKLQINRLSREFRNEYDSTNSGRTSTWINNGIYLPNGVNYNTAIIVVTWSNPQKINWIMFSELSETNLRLVYALRFSGFSFRSIGLHSISRNPRLRVVVIFLWDSGAPDSDFASGEATSCKEQFSGWCPCSPQLTAHEIRVVCSTIQKKKKLLLESKTT